MEPTQKPQKSKVVNHLHCVHVSLHMHTVDAHFQNPGEASTACSTWAMGSSSRDEGRLFRSESLSTSLRHNMNSMVARPTYCPIVAALAAPITPHPATKTKNKSRLRLTAFAAALAISGVLHHTTAHSFIACRSLVSTHHNCCRNAMHSQDHESRCVAVADGQYQT
jgi:hypothetical protein